MSGKCDVVEICTTGNCTELFHYQITVCIPPTIQANHTLHAERYAIKSYGSATIHFNYTEFTKPGPFLTLKKIIKYFLIFA